MVRKLILTILFFQFSIISAVALGSVELIFEDFNDHDKFNNFSGNWGILGPEEATTTSTTFDVVNRRGAFGAGLKIDYDLSSVVPKDTYGGIWNSLIGRSKFEDPYLHDNQYLDFIDLYRELKNSSGNSADIEDIRVTGFSFWAKGNTSDGDFYHVVKVEVKDIYRQMAVKTFNIPNSSDWTKYEFPFLEGQMGNVDLTKMKELVFVLLDSQNDDRSSHFFLDDLSFATTEIAYDASEWSDDEFLDIVSHRLFNYFLVFTDDLGFALDRSSFSDSVSVGAIGFQLAAYCIGDQRNWAEDLDTKVESILQKLVSLPMGPETGLVKSGCKGFFYHFLEANTGKRKDKYVEISLYDTMLLMHGVLIAKEYFKDNPTIQVLAQSLYDAVDWFWMVDTISDNHKFQFHLRWTPEIYFEYHADGYTDEAFLVDVLALGSNTHPVTMDTYNARSRFFGVYPPSSSYDIAASWAGSLFNYFFASCWLDIEHRGIDRHATEPLNIWENNRQAIIANRQFCIDHQDDVVGNGDNYYTTYGPTSWGLTASDNLAEPSSKLLSEYYAFGALPTQQNIQHPETYAPHLGTVAVYGAGSSIVYLPDEVIATLRNYYSNTELWIPLFGFGDAYSNDPHYFEAESGTGQPVLDDNDNLKIDTATWLDGGPWTNHVLMGVNVGPMLLAIENYRSGLIWNLSNQNPNIKAGLDLIFRPPTCTGDLDFDFDVDGTDLARFIKYFQQNNRWVDLNYDFTLDNQDVGMFAERFGRDDCP